MKNNGYYVYKISIHQTNQYEFIYYTSPNSGII